MKTFGSKYILRAFSRFFWGSSYADHNLIFCRGLLSENLEQRPLTRRNDDVADTRSYHELVYVRSWINRSAHSWCPCLIYRQHIRCPWYRDYINRRWTIVIHSSCNPCCYINFIPILVSWKRARCKRIQEHHALARSLTHINNILRLSFSVIAFDLQYYFKDIYLKNYFSLFFGT